MARVKKWLLESDIWAATRSQTKRQKLQLVISTWKERGSTSPKCVSPKACTAPLTMKMAFGCGEIRLKPRLASFTTLKIAKKEATPEKMKIAAMVKITMTNTLTLKNQQNWDTSKIMDLKFLTLRLVPRLSSSKWKTRIRSSTSMACLTDLMMF